MDKNNSFANKYISMEFKYFFLLIIKIFHIFSDENLQQFFFNYRDNSNMTSNIIYQEIFQNLNQVLLLFIIFYHIFLIYFFNIQKYIIFLFAYSSILMCYFKLIQKCNIRLKFSHLSYKKYIATKIFILVNFKIQFIMYYRQY